MSKFSEFYDEVERELSKQEHADYSVYFAAIAGQRLHFLLTDGKHSDEYYSVMNDALSFAKYESGETLLLLCGDSSYLAKILGYEYTMVDSFDDVLKAAGAEGYIDGEADGLDNGEVNGSDDNSDVDEDYAYEWEDNEDDVVNTDETPDDADFLPYLTCKVCGKKEYDPNIVYPYREENGWSDVEFVCEACEAKEVIGKAGTTEEGTNVKEPEADKNEAAPNSNKGLDSEIEQTFGGTISNLTQKLMLRYNLLFKSGFDLSKPYGILSQDGVLYVDSAGHCGVRHRAGRNNIDFSTSNGIYTCINHRLHLVESPLRSKLMIATKILEGYKSSAKLYFTHKMLEIMYGMKSVADNSAKERSGDQLVMYGRSEVGNKWSGAKGSGYSSEVESWIHDLFIRCVDSYAKYMHWDRLDTVEIVDTLKPYLEYIASCMSNCIAFIDYKCSNNSPVSFKLRISDDKRSFAGVDLTPELIQVAFAGNAGSSERKSIGSGLDSNESEQYGVYEYAHEFNHTLATAMPLFAYKALIALKEKGENPDWKHLIMGQSVDGTILRNGDKGINIGANIFHHINAGSRSGKGVMTLAFLTAALAAGKIPIYFDNKPDMASLLCYLSNDKQVGDCPAGFIMNGSNLEDDHYGAFKNCEAWINPNNIPVEARFLFGDVSWHALGDLYYMRAMILAIGLVIARGLQVGGVRDDPAIGGHNGLMIVLDEFNVFQDRFKGIMLTIGNNIPPQKSMYSRLIQEISAIEVDESSKNFAKKNMERNLKARDLVTGFCGSKNYALAILKSLADSIDEIGGKSNAGFSDEEAGYSDIFVIGQNLQPVPISRDAITSTVGMDRLNQDLLKGLPKNDVGYAVRGANSIPYKMTSFRTSDAIIGYNGLYPDYLKQTDPKSKAFGVLDRQARGFAYVPKFELKDGSMESPGKQLCSLEKANNSGVVYFRPYLILNNGNPGDRFVSDTYKYAGEAGIPKEDLVAEYPNEDGTELNECVGFEEYVKLLGLDNIGALLRQGGDVANEAVRRMGYVDDGSGRPLWLQLVTDLRPEWIFSVKDVEELVTGTGKGNIGKGVNNPLLSEYYAYSKDYARLKREGVSIEDPSLSTSIGDGTEDVGVDPEISQRIMFGGDDGSNPELEEESARRRQGEAMGDYGIDIDDMTDLFGDDDSEDVWNGGSRESSGEGPGRSEGANDSWTGTAEGTPTERDPMEIFSRVREENPIGGVVEPDLRSDEEVQRKIREMLDELQRMGLNVSVDMGGYTVRPNATEINTGYTVSDVEQNVGEAGFSPEFNIVSDDEDTYINSYRELMFSITAGMIRDFGGLSRIKSVAVCGGAVAINNMIYRTKVSEQASRLLPIDVRKQVNAGQICELIDWSFIKQCPALTKLASDSTDFMYSCINEAPGYEAGKTSVKWYFKAIPSLQVLQIGKTTYLKEDVMSRDFEDPFIQRSRAYQIADACRSGLGRTSGKIWKWGFNNAFGKDKRWYQRIFGGAFGVAGGVVTGVAAGAAAITQGAASVIDRASTNKPKKEKKPGIFGRLKGGIKDILDG